MNRKNKPKLIACGVPDYIVTRKEIEEIPDGYIEAKNIGKNLKRLLFTIRKIIMLIFLRILCR
jgi:hypothetical protein